MACVTPSTPTAMREETDMITPTQPLLTADHLNVSFRTEGGRVHAVRDVSFTLGKGELVALVGESGSGKSVTARTLMGLLPQSARLEADSRVDFDGEEISRYGEKQMMKLRGNRIAMIFQEPMTSLNPVYTIASQVGEMIRAHRRVSKQEARERTLALLTEVGIPQPEERLDQYPHQLSGGQRQRVMIAMALANEPELLIADEPTTALDVTVQAQILQLIRRLQKSHGMSVLLITHDLTIVQQYADRVYVMEKGQVVEEGATHDIFECPQHRYTRMLLASEPSGSADPIPADSPLLLEALNMQVNFRIGKKKLFSPKPRPRLKAVDDISLALKRGEALGIVGESGSGKTTLGQAILGLLDAESHGEVIFDGQPIHSLSREAMRPLRKRMQIVFQDPFASLNPRMTVRQIIHEGMEINRIGETRAERHRLAAQALSDAGLGEFALERFPHEFSGGQRQRIAIARAIALEPEFLLLDEPTSALDLTVQRQIIELLKGLQKKYGLSYLFISHDLRVVRALCQRVMVMQAGRVVEAGPTEQVMVSPEEDYTQRLIKAAFEVRLDDEAA
ncbi:ABC transporter ATP-binding protein [Halomonas nitroreducens]|uniref:ABC-type dipeptide transporter n=2 Tax=Halomonas nitroreducens TaxID=447425 RepID=A0A3S0HS92_9GAMM|nr:ABC transporter ATP-binding protein [Halomonas nitroreducens]